MDKTLQKEQGTVTTKSAKATKAENKETDGAAQEASKNISNRLK